MTLPNVTGDTFTVAQNAIASAGFTTPATQGCVVVTDPTQVGVAVSTKPVQGTAGPPTTPITVNIGKLTSCP